MVVMKKSLSGITLLFFSFFLILLTASSCSVFSLTAVGSTTVLVPMQDISYDYHQLSSKNRLSVNGGGSETGVVFAERRLADFGMASRYPTQGEASSSKWNGLATYSIGFDVIAFPYNLNGTGYGIKPNQKLVLKPIDLFNIYDDKTTSWAQLAQKSYTNLTKTGGGDSAIHVVTRENGSGTQASFYEAFNKVYFPNKNISDRNLPSDALVATSNGLAISYVGTNNGAIGYCSSFVLDNAIKQKSYPHLASSNVEISSNITIEPGNKAGRENVYKYGIAPEYNFKKDSYAFWHPLNLITDTKSKNLAAIRNLLTFIMQKENQLITNDYISLLHDNMFELFGKKFANNATGIKQLVNFMLTADKQKGINLKVLWHW